MNESQPTILLVDDDPDLRRLLSLHLEAVGYSVKAVDSGEAALSCLATEMPRLIITDIRMAGMDGMTLFREIQRQRPDIPVIILTAYGTIPDAVRATQAGVFQFLSKPFDGQELLAMIRKALALTAAVTAQADSDAFEWCCGIITRSPTMEALLGEARLIAQSEANVFITGESGTGKELLAKAIHKASPRHARPCVAINCGAIPGELLESELFGHTKGAFTGATTAHKGLFQAADEGILFLDEIGDLPMILQAKLLRTLQEQQIRPVGSVQDITIDVRIISATHNNLEEMLKNGTFREDLYYRLNVVSLTLPPLRKRREDIPLLANQFLMRLAEKNQRKLNKFAPEAMELLIRADWPGNIRQLHNAVEYCVALATTSIIPAALVKRVLRNHESGAIPSFSEARQHFERDYLVQLLHLTHGKVTQAANLAQRNRTDFYKLLTRHGISPALFKG